MKSITLYNKQREKVGETYPRRAKQLVRSGRATWLEENIALQLTADLPLTANTREEYIMAEQNIHPTNSSPETENQRPDLAGNDDFLMYLARKNVRKKTNLIKNIVAFAAVSLVLVILLESLASGSHWQAQQARRLLGSFSQVMASPYLTAYDELWSVIWFLERISYAIHPIWTFILGIMAAWGGWILTNAAIIIAGRIPAKRPDHVAAEYMRLKNLTSDKL